MTTPGLLFCAALFWGYCTDLPWLGLAMGLLLEAPRLIKTRFDFELRHAGSMTDICTMAFAVSYYFHVNQEEISIQEGATFFTWLPLYFLPAILLQLYGTRNSYDARIFFILSRKRALAAGSKSGPQVHLGWVYVVLLMLSACMANKRFVLFYPALGLLAVATLCSFRNRRFPLYKTWLPLVLVVLSLGELGHRMVGLAQQFLEQRANSWFGAQAGLNAGQFIQSSALGSVGTIQKNNAIVLRVFSGKPLPANSYFKICAYDSLLGDYSWMAMDPAEPQVYSNRISIGPGRESGQTFDIWYYADGGTACLPLPGTAIAVCDLNATLLQRPALGGLKSVAGPEWLHYKVPLSEEETEESAPGEADLSVPERLLPMLAETCKSWFGDKTSHADVLAILKEKFSTYDYTLHLPKPPAGRERLEYFLNESRAGHCEYFATCTTLLLRQMGIPARYTTGYVVDEYSELEGSHVARGSSAHAWVRAWVGNRWTTVETTPSSQDSSAFFRPVRDIFSWLEFSFESWRQSPAGRQWLGILPPIILVALVLFLGWRMRDVKRKSRHKSSSFHYIQSNQFEHAEIWHARLMDWFAKRDWARESWETPEDWCRRLKQGKHLPQQTARLDLILSLANEFYYDPMPPSADRLREWVEMIQQWLQSPEIGQPES